MADFILGITGKKRSGKDTFAQRLISHHGFTRLSFADALRNVALDLDPVIEFHTEYGPIRLGEVLGASLDWETAKEVPEVRRILQHLGVAMREHVDPDVWVNAVRRQAEQISGPVVITDVRFPNEADFVTELVRVVRPGLVSADTHISETALDDRPASVILNDADVDALHDRADFLAAYLGL